MRRKINIRKGTPEDSGYFSDFIQQSAGTVLPAFGKNAAGILTSLFVHKRNLFSFEHCYFALLEGNITGMILGYSCEAERKERFRTSLLLFRFLNLTLLRSLSVLSRINATFGDFKSGDYYISNIAVYPHYRGLGIAGELLSRVEDEARSDNTNRIILDVETDSVAAVNLYRKTGYASTGDIKPITIDNKNYTFTRMFKNL
jgi:ribosomal protein S18 acetylase RimI-like enzyme